MIHGAKYVTQEPAVLYKKRTKEGALFWTLYCSKRTV